MKSIDITQLYKDNCYQMLQEINLDEYTITVENFDDLIGFAVVYSPNNFSDEMIEWFKININHIIMSNLIGNRYMFRNVINDYKSFATLIYQNTIDAINVNVKESTSFNVTELIDDCKLNRREEIYLDYSNVEFIINGHHELQMLLDNYEIIQPEMQPYAECVKFTRITLLKTLYTYVINNEMSDSIDWYKIFELHMSRIKHDGELRILINHMCAGDTNCMKAYLKLKLNYQNFNGDSNVGD